MNTYPKSILSIEQQLNSYKEAGMIVDSDEDAKHALRTIGYYRLRGYAFPFYDNQNKKYRDGCSLSQIISIYNFDMQLATVLTNMLSKIEIALRTRLTDAILSVHSDALALYDPAVFRNKKVFWNNLSSVSKEISRSNDVFIKHNYQHYDGLIPVWAAVETLSFGTLSKIIKNMAADSEGAFKHLAKNYKYKTDKGNVAVPSLNNFSTWTHALVILRNLCAHHSRIYNKRIVTQPVILNADKTSCRADRLYGSVLAMKYLRPDNVSWNKFVDDLNQLIYLNMACIDIDNIGFPIDWKDHLYISTGRIV